MCRKHPDASLAGILMFIFRQIRNGCWQFFFSVIFKECHATNLSEATTLAANAQLSSLHNTQSG
jgi:hypothetical protein